MILILEIYQTVPGAGGQRVRGRRQVPGPDPHHGTIAAASFTTNTRYRIPYTLTKIPQTVQSSLCTLVCMFLVCLLFMTNPGALLVSNFAIFSTCLGKKKR